LKIIPTHISGVILIETIPFRDERGGFFRAFCQHELKQIIGNRKIEQINISQTSSVGTIRGMHYQRQPCSEMKFVRCIGGKVWDVAVDLRKDSTTFLQWYAAELSAVNNNMLVIPEGCAHGFQVLKANSELLYLHTASYAPESERGIRYDDPLVAIKWPLPVGAISERDKSYMPLQSDHLNHIL
jgi:dTDP-4-dehydrorhamnose 3,5-epimerase